MSETKADYKLRNPGISQGDICPECDEAIGPDGVCYYCICGCDYCESPTLTATTTLFEREQVQEIVIEKGVDEPIVNDSDILGRMQEHGLSSCQFGCKHYKDPETGFMVLGHNRSYGCNRTKADILDMPNPTLTSEVTTNVN